MKFDYIHTRHSTMHSTLIVYDREMIIYEKDRKNNPSICRNGVPEITKMKILAQQT